MDNYHTPVLLKETIEGLNPSQGKLYIDATVGGGGHTQRILELGGRVLGIDQDEDAILHLNKKFESEIKKGQLILALNNFSAITDTADKCGFANTDGILFDLGVSSHQIDNSGRGFSFSREEVLDMRMSKDTRITAFEIINTANPAELYEIFVKFGEEVHAKRIVEAIIESRKNKEIKTTKELTDTVLKVVKRSGKSHPATRIFQAIRIAVNSEMGNLDIGLSDGFKLLKKGGRMVVISFHSLEDRKVKNFIREQAQKGYGNLITKKPIIAGFDETSSNKRSRSAKLRIIEKI